MSGPYGEPTWIACECGQKHLVLEAEVGELVENDAPRLWRVATTLLVGFVDIATDQPPQPVHLWQGWLLRYDQRDYDSTYRHQGWDRFRILSGPRAGTCVTIYVPSETSPVSPQLTPIAAESGEGGTAPSCDSDRGRAWPKIRA